MVSPVVVIDNGASTLKTGILKRDQPSEPRIISNAVVKSNGDKTTYYGHEIENCQDYSALHYRLPFEKGYLTDWDAQKAVWDGLFSSESDLLGIDTTEASLLITEPYFNLPNIQEVYDQFVFEEYEFRSYFRCTPASLIPHGNLFTLPDEPDLPRPECMIIVDSGFSFTHVVPIMSGKVVWSAVKRLDVGGKLLTNQLKELVSFRQWNMMDETFIMNQVKEACCYVSTDFYADLETVRKNPLNNPIVQSYVLPDISANRKGHIRTDADDAVISDHDQNLIMGNERFSVPELIFRPDDIGLNQSGLSATILSSISLLPEDLQVMFWGNIGLIGGSTKCPGFKNRLMQELRMLAPVGADVIVYECTDPITAAYHSAVSFVSSPNLFFQNALTRAEYLEGGSNAARRKFAAHDWRGEISITSKGKGKLREDGQIDRRRTRHIKIPQVQTEAPVAVESTGPSRRSTRGSTSKS